MYVYAIHSILYHFSSFITSSLPLLPHQVILFGEHAVVFGRRAVAMGVDLRTTLTLEPLAQPQVVLDLPIVAINM